uniref:Uncharacterized protein n=1 Tax=Cacopsylla melanoneura TaxID=428564 RepID=A0A8D8YAU5_9HEMI
MMFSRLPNISHVLTSRVIRGNLIHRLHRTTAPATLTYLIDHFPISSPHIFINISTKMDTMKTGYLTYLLLKQHLYVDVDGYIILICKKMNIMDFVELGIYPGKYEKNLTDSAKIVR